MESTDAEPQGHKGPQSEAGETRSRWRGVFITCAILLILYPLSLGPVSYLQFRNFPPSPVTDSVVSTIYAPLWRYSRSEAFLAESYQQYLEWWITKALEENMKHVRW